MKCSGPATRESCRRPGAARPDERPAGAKCRPADVCLDRRVPQASANCDGPQARSASISPRAAGHYFCRGEGVPTAPLTRRLRRRSHECSG